MYYYKNEATKREIEFLIQKNGAAIPIEVKAGNTRANSLNLVLKDKPQISLAYKLIDGNIGTSENGVITLPLYMGMFI